MFERATRECKMMLQLAFIGKIRIGRKVLVNRAMITSKLTSKAQTTIPQPIRAALHLREGDELAYIIEDGRVILMKAQGEPIDDPFGAFAEWDSDADRKAYAKL
jgi:antitoxin PrlF